MEQMAMADRQDHPETDQSAGRTDTVLIVDDDVDLLELMEKALKAKYQVRTARSAPEALDILQANTVQLLITDQYMPGMTGVELLKRARAEKPEIGRLLITGREDVQVLIDAVNQGEVQHYLRKPWAPEDLVAAVGEMAEKHHLRDDNRRLAQMEAELRATLDSIGDGFFACDSDWRFVYVNAVAERLLGLRRHEVVGRHLWEGLPLLLGTSLEAEYRQAMAGEVRDSENYYAPRQLWLHSRCFPRQGGGMSVYFQDVTDRKRAEAELWDSQGRYRFLVDHLPAGLLVHGEDERVILSNPKACSLLGLAAEAMQGRLAADPAWQFYQENMVPMPVEDYPARRVFATGQPVTNQVIGIRRRANSACVWMLSQAFPDFDAQGRVRQAVVMLTDISRRKETEVALQTSEARYRELYRSAQRQTLEMTLLDQVRTVVAGELDLAAVIRKVVETIADTFNYPLVSLYLRQGDTMRLQHQVGYETFIKEIPIAQGILGKVMRTGKPILLSNAQSDPDSLAAVPAIASEVCVPLLDGDQVVGILNIESRGFELTEADLRLLTTLGGQIGLALGRARLYTQVREDAATRAILLHEVNHRVKNNLSAIIGLLQLQQDYLPAQAQAAHGPLFQDLISRIRSLAAVHDLLSASSWAPVSVHELAERVIQAVVSIVPAQAKVTVELPPSPIQVTAKMAGPLALILNELATNSLKHALPQTPALRLSLTIAQEAGQIELEYRDNGPGFPPAVLSGEQHNVGLHLIRLLSRHDLRGKIDLLNDGGAVARLHFGAGGETLAPAPTGPLSISDRLT